MDGELLSLKWNNHKSTFLQVVGNLRVKATYTDATLACNGNFYPVHRLVLSSCSEYFNAIFEHTTCKSPVVVLKDIDSKNLEYLLDYMYVGEVNVRQNELGALVTAAECLKIKGLAVPDEHTSTINSNITHSRNISNSRSRSSSPPSKRKKILKSSDSSRSNSSSEKKNDDLSTETEEIEQATTTPSFSSIKLEPNEIEDTNSSNHDQSTGPNSSLETRKLEVDVADGIDTRYIVEKEEPVDVNEENSSDIGGSLLYDNEEHSWRGEDGFQSDLMDVISGSVNSEPSCSSQQQDQQLKYPLWTTDYLHLDSIASTSSQIDPIASLQDQFGSKLKHFKAELSKLRASGIRSNFNHNKLFRRNRQLIVGDGGGGMIESYDCNLCSYSSKEKANLRRHMMTHTGEKPFKCPICDYRSVAYHTIKRHFRTHTKEKPYACSICEFRCSCSDTLKRHMLLKHNAT